ncbi:hypothetical protein SEA_BEELZEBUB_95 [Mycobacterium phage Beelzebub]|uniref:Uncharacterized protein n=1 Tax=Mycobacterium phage Beelzebub TaxID=2488783 RepID=A0A3G8FEV7_9CAUD|nr:hypothetical protein SEA_BEELZEBUB_95 [Mycobacterium phage Beelzebub]
MPMRLDSQTGWVVKKSPSTGRWEACNWFFKSSAKAQEFDTAREAWDFVVASTYGRHDLHRIENPNCYRPTLSPPINPFLRPSHRPGLGRWNAEYLIVPMRYVMGMEGWSLTRPGWEAVLDLPEGSLQCLEGVENGVV